MGTTYKTKKCCMMIGITELQSCTVPKFGLLHDIILYGQEPNILETVKYNSTFGAYETSLLTEYRCLYRSSIQCYHPFNPITHGDSTTKLIKSKNMISLFIVIILYDLIILTIS